MFRPKVNVIAQGTRYRLGWTDEFGGIWRRRPWGWRLISRYPLNDDARRVAEQQFYALEPDFSPEAPPRGGFRRGPVILAGTAVVVIAAVVALVVNGQSQPQTYDRAGGVVGRDGSFQQGPAPTSAPAQAAPGSGYLASGSGYVVFLQWDQNGSALTGTIHTVTTNGSPPDEQTSSSTGTIYGTLRGGSISISFNGNPASFGTVSDGSFILDVPQADGTLASMTFTRASAQNFDDDVTALSAEVTSANHQAAVLGQEEAAIDKDARQAASDLSDLMGADFSTDLGGLSTSAQGVASDLQQIKHEYSQFQTDLATNNQYGQACTDVGGSINAELAGGVAAEISGGVLPELNSIESGIQGLRQVIQSAPGDVSAYQSAQDGLPSYKPKTAVGPLQPALATADSAISRAISQANTVVDQVNSEAQQALHITEQAAQAGNCGISVQAPPTVAHLR